MYYGGGGGWQDELSLRVHSTYSVTHSNAHTHVYGGRACHDFWLFDARIYARAGIA